MPRRSTRFALLPFALVLLVPLAAGCGGGSGASGVTLDPTGQSQPDPTPAGLIADGQGRADLAFGGYTLLVDGEQASLTPWRTGANNDDLYFLGIDRFLSPASMRVTGIAVTGTEVQVHWRFTHPFPAPNLFAPPSGRNRADLGVAARILLLEEVPAGQVGDRTFFGTAIANTDLLLNPDGYWQPRGLLEAGTANANTFPYQLVVDEGANAGNGNRDDHAGGNGGRGNYDPSIGGWQRANMGGDSASWTGYGVIHQG
ncbi:MAG TPA: hypothetical protein VEI97_01155, partial [bacterium]|nr:hypothetical protein [bacterium]